MKIKKLIAMVLTWSLLLCLYSPASATQASNAHSLEPSIQNQMLRILLSIEKEKEKYGFNNVDFSAIQIGREIPAYKVSGENLVNSDIRLIPVIYNDELLSIFYIAQDINGATYVQLSDELVDSLSVYTEPIAIIYGDDATYVYTEDEIYFLGLKEQSDYTNTNIEACDINILATSQKEDKNLIRSLLSSMFIETSEYDVENTTLNVQKFSEQINYALASTGVSEYLLVDIIKQPANTNICWAIAVTSILNYILGENLNYEEIVEMFTNGEDIGQYTEQIISDLYLCFGLDWGCEYSNSIDPSEVLYYLSSGYPLYGDFTRSGGAHAVVIRGINTVLKTFSVMNPIPNTTSYTSGTISSSGVWTFISGYSGSTYTLRSYAFPIDT